MSNSMHHDPAEGNLLMRLFYRDWRPTRIGRWVGRFMIWWRSLGLPLRDVIVLEVSGGSGRLSLVPMVVTSVEARRYLVSMLGSGSNWVKNVEAAHGEAILRQGRDWHAVQLVAVPPNERAPILKEYVRVATSGRKHFPVKVGAPLSEFQAIAERYPVYRIEPSEHSAC